MPRSFLLTLVLALGCTLLVREGTTAAQGAEAVIGDDTAVIKFDPASCVQAPPAPAAVSPGGIAAPPVTWSGFELVGKLTDSPEVVRALFEPTLQRHRALTDTARDDIRKIAASFGYHLIGLTTKETPAGTRAVVALAPLPMVRKIDVDVRQGWFDTQLDDEIRRRMRVRIGGYLPWTPLQRACELYDEKIRIEEFLRDEGYFQGRVSIAPKLDGTRMILKVKVALRDEYTTGIVNLAPREPDNIDDDEIRKIFRHKANCLVWKLCFGTARFKRSQHQDDLQKVADLYHRGGYPAVRVRSDFDPLTSFDRRTQKVNFAITIDQRRQVFVVFEGYDAERVTEEQLTSQLTFDQAASSDDVEASESAKAIAAFLQGRGYFDARVTWSRERFERFDRIIYRIEQGKLRRVEKIEFVGNHAVGFDADALEEVVAARTVGGLSSSLFGKGTAITSAQLALDADRIAETYRRAGYRDATVRVSAATTPAALDSAALTAALVTADRGAGLYVRYTISEGLPTLLSQIQVDVGGKGDALTTPAEHELCALVLADLAVFYAEPQLARPAAPDRCVATAANLKFREAEAIDTRDLLRDRLFSHGRPRAKVAYEPIVLGPHRVAATYKLTDVQALTIGKVVIRGNFRTRSSVILGELRLKEGQPLTKDALAEGARRLRNTTLFDAVNVALPDLDNVSEGTVNAVVEVVERHDLTAQIDAETGYSTYNGAFVRLIPQFKNLFGLGMSLDLSGTVGFDLPKALEQDLSFRQLAAEATFRIPQWLVPDWSPFLFQTELTAFRRQQDTPRFGELTTDGVTLSFLRTKSWPRIGTRQAHAWTIGTHYDFRRRERLVDVLRPPGADDDQTQVPITTRTGSIGASFEWEQRVDRAGTLSPLAPEAGFRFEAQVSYASPYLAGQDTFVKASAAGSKYWPLGTNLVLRADLRYDQGFPLGGAVLLPEVERFFGGGDSTVRGYEDDRLATEIVQVGVPPIDNVQQLRILPAGGNIRVMSSVDAQLRIWKVLATAVFVDAGMITNQWTTVTEDDIRPSIGVALIRVVTPFGTGALERAMPLQPHLGDNPRGRWHLSFAARAQF